MLPKLPPMSATFIFGYLYNIKMRRVSHNNTLIFKNSPSLSNDALPLTTCNAASYTLLIMISSLYPFESFNASSHFVYSFLLHVISAKNNL